MYEEDDAYVNNISDKLIFTYYSYFSDWYLYESGYTPIDFLSKHFDRIYSASAYTSKKIFDYKNNKLSDENNLSHGDDCYVYFCVINPTDNTVIPVFKMCVDLNINRKIACQKDVYTKYIVK